MPHEVMQPDEVDTGLCAARWPCLTSASLGRERRGSSTRCRLSRTDIKAERRAHPRQAHRDTESQSTATVGTSTPQGPMLDKTSLA